MILTSSSPRSCARGSHAGTWLATLVLVAAVAASLLADGARSASSPQGLIAFARDDGIYVMRSDGSGVRALWRGQAAKRSLAPLGVGVLTWSPDGRKLAFDGGGGARGRHIWVMDADGSHRARIASPAASPAWSPDGRRIAFTPLGPKAKPDWPKRAIWVMSADGSGMRRLLSLSGLGKDVGPNHIDWSPDGRRFMLSAHGGWLAWIYVVNVDGTNLRRLSPRGWAWDEHPEWSPDGRRIAYSGSPGTVIGPDTPEIYVTDPAGRVQVRLTRNGVADESPTWSADGSKIAFVRKASEIHVMNANGTGLRMLTVGRSPAWQPVAAP